MSGQLFRGFDCDGRTSHKVRTRPMVHRINDFVVDLDKWRDHEAAADFGKWTEANVINKLLASNISHLYCEYCGEKGSETKRSCGMSCYTEFKKAFIPHSGRVIDIKRHSDSEMRYGVFVRPRSKITACEYIGEYLGELVPIGSKTSRYMFQNQSRVFEVDAERKGNWTRFINSHCVPNVKVWSTMCGKRHMLLLQTTRDIEEKEELYISYGRSYFESLGILCCCSAQDEPHLPPLVPTDITDTTDTADTTDATDVTDVTDNTDTTGTTVREDEHE